MKENATGIDSIHGEHFASQEALECKGEVLLVEDDVDLLSFYELFLGISGFRVWGSVTTGEAAVERYRNASSFPDVVILDHRLPGKNGIQIASQILELDPKACIILCTADGNALEDALRVGIRRFKRKPFDNEALLKNVQDAVAERKALCNAS